MPKTHPKPAGLALVEFLCWFAGLLWSLGTVKLLVGNSGIKIAGQVAERSQELLLLLPFVATTAAVLFLIAWGIRKRHAWARILVFLYLSINLVGAGVIAGGIKNVAFGFAALQIVLFSGLLSWYLYFNKSVRRFYQGSSS